MQLKKGKKLPHFERPVENLALFPNKCQNFLIAYNALATTGNSAMPYVITKCMRLVQIKTGQLGS